MMKRYIEAILGIAAVWIALLGIGSAVARGVQKPSDAPPDDPYAAARERMVQRHLVERDIEDERVLEAFRTVPRHRFVPEEYRRLAYDDESLPIGEGQTITPPFDVAFMTELLDPRPTDKVYEVGTGSGYQASILAQLVDEVYSVEIHELLDPRPTDKVYEVGTGSGYQASILAQLVDEVYSVEIHEPLARGAAQVIQELGYENIHSRTGDGYLGWPEEAPFDKIIVTCAPEAIPPPLIEQLREGGRMVIPIGSRFDQKVYVFDKVDGKLEGGAVRPTLFVPMTGKAQDEDEAATDRERDNPDDDGRSEPHPS